MGMGAALERGSPLFATLAALAASLVLGAAVPTGMGFYAPVVLLAAVYVPGALLAGALLGRLGSPGAVFHRDYSALFTCAALGWTAAVLPLAAAVWLSPQRFLAGLAGAAFLYFAAQMFFAARILFGLGNGAAAATVGLSWIAPVLVALYWPAIHYLLRWIASPFFLLYAWYFLGGELSGLGRGLTGRQSFQRMLEAAAVNPHDADAQYQLGLIHLERRQYPEAIRRFRNAVHIDPEETGAHFQLGRLAREQGRTEEAIGEFETVLAQDEKYSLNEIHREAGAAYLAAGRPEEARRELEIYASRRAYDPEGLYYLGRALEALGESAAAKDAYRRAVEAASAAPRYQRRFAAKWSRLAQRRAAPLSK
jgi:tetratricopeptide (TPR) repeat protein